MSIIGSDELSNKIIECETEGKDTKVLIEVWRLAYDLHKTMYGSFKPLLGSKMYDRKMRERYDFISAIADHYIYDHDTAVRKLQERTEREDYSDN